MNGITGYGYQTTEFRKSKQDESIRYYVNGNNEAWTNAIPTAVTAKLDELKTYDVLLQKIEDSHSGPPRLIEIRKYKDGQYGKKNTIKGEFMRWNSAYPKTFDYILTKDVVEQELALVPFQLDKQKIEAELKIERRRAQQEEWAMIHADMKERRILKEEREEAIRKMVEQFPQFPEIGEYLQETINKEADMIENKTINELRDEVSNLKSIEILSQQKIKALQRENTHLLQENQQLLRENLALKEKKRKWFGGVLGVDVAGPENAKTDECKLRVLLDQMRGLSV